jgi:NADPH:quinone reductase-like Zn-dependent oxidoreductase
MWSNMKTWHLTSQTGPEGLQLVELPDPTPGPGEVVVRVRATSLNYRDLMIATDQYGPGIKLPLVPLSDGAGEIVAVGEGVTSCQVGDRVAGQFFQKWANGPLQPAVFASALGGALDGMLSTRVKLAAAGVIPFPEHLSFEEAATLPCAALTAWQALVTHGRVSADQTVLIQGTGGVSLFGLQIAKMHGARVIITSSRDDKLARARELGADLTINYRTTPAWDEEILRLTDGAGVDQVVEVGGHDTFGPSLRALATNGFVGVIGGVSGFTTEVALRDILVKNARIRGIFVGNRDMFAAMNRAFGRHQLRPVIDRVFPWDEAPAAYRHLASGSHFGKIVIAAP